MRQVYGDGVGRDLGVRIVLKIRFLSNEWVAETVFEFFKRGDAQGACNKLVQAAREAW